jgi:putative oxidoreductase
MDKVALLARILLSAIFLRAGYGKLMAPSASMAMIAHNGFPVPEAAYVVAVGVELGGGALVLLGYHARWAAAVLAAFCLVTAFQVHWHPNDPGQMINFWKNVAIAGGFLQLAATGPGRLSLSRR